MNNDLHQSDKWITAEGVVMHLDDMGPRHLADVLAFLRRRARALKQRADVNLCLVRDEHVDGAFEAAYDQQFAMRPTDWLESTPLVTRLRVLTGEESPNAHVPWISNPTPHGEIKCHW